MTTDEWRVSFHPEVTEDLKSISHSDVGIILDAIDKKLKIAPTDFGKRLKNELHPLLRLRIQSYRVVYEVDPRKRRVRILLIGIRKNVYKAAKKAATSRRSSE